MTTAPTHGMEHALPEEGKGLRFLSGGSTIEAFAGFTALILAILGLARLFPMYMDGVTTIIVGLALAFEGEAVAARSAHLLHSLGWTHSEEFTGGITAEFLGGTTGLILGLLSLLGLGAGVMTPAAVVVYGAAILLGAGTTARLNSWAWRNGPTSTPGYMAMEVMSLSQGAQVLTGLGAIVLGILALAGFAPMVLTLVALLALGATILLNGSALSGRVFSLFRG